MPQTHPPPCACADPAGLPRLTFIGTLAQSSKTRHAHNNPLSIRAGRSRTIGPGDMFPNQQTHLLIVDDDPLISDTLTYVLTRTSTSLPPSRAPSEKAADAAGRTAAAGAGRPRPAAAAAQARRGFCPDRRPARHLAQHQDSGLSGQATSQRAPRARARRDRFRRQAVRARTAEIPAGSTRWLVQDADAAPTRRPPRQDSGIVGTAPAMDKLRQQINSTPPRRSRC